MKILIKLLMVCMMLFSAHVLATDSKEEGFLQAFWLPDWNDNNINNPSLELRFFSYNKTGKLEKVIEIDKKDLNVKFVKDKFNNIPDEFLRYKEGHVEQRGELTFSHFIVTKDCDANTYSANYVAFTPDNKSTPLSQEIKSCGSYPYQLSYMIKEGQPTIMLKDKPNDDGKKIAVAPADKPLIKIKTIDDNWYYVAVYDDSKPESMGDVRGYIKSSVLDPMN